MKDISVTIIKSKLLTRTNISNSSTMLLFIS